MFILPLNHPALPFFNFSLFLNSISRFLNSKHHAQLNFAETSAVTRAHVLMGERALNYVMTPNASSTVYAPCDILGDFFKNEGQHLVKSNCKEMKPVWVLQNVSLSLQSRSSVISTLAMTLFGH